MFQYVSESEYKSLSKKQKMYKYFTYGVMFKNKSKFQNSYINAVIQMVLSLNPEFTWQLKNNLNDVK
jgi:hypothetical protein